MILRSPGLTDGNAVIDPQQTRRSLERALQTLDLRDGRLQNPGLSVIPDLAVDEIQTVHHQSSLRVPYRGVLSGIVISSELGYQVGTVLGSVDGEGLWDGQERRGEFCNG